MHPSPILTEAVAVTAAAVRTRRPRSVLLAACAVLAFGCADAPTAPPAADAPSGGLRPEASVAPDPFEQGSTGRVRWSANGAEYEIVSTTAITWEEAKAAAERRGGHLATLTSGAENQFVVQMALDHDVVRYGVWVGGYQRPGSPEPAGGWVWLTGEPIPAPWQPGFQSWSLPHNPGNHHGAEHHLQFHLLRDASLGRWNDFDTNWKTDGYVVEYPDRSPPVITPVLDPAAPDGAEGWYVSPVSVRWTVEDESPFSLDPNARCGRTDHTDDTAPEGIDVTCGATSFGGHASATVTLRIDRTAPEVRFEGNLGSYTVDQRVAIACTVVDPAPGSGTSDDCDDVDAAAYTLPLGSTTLSAAGADRAGNSASAETRFTVQVTFGSLCAVVRTLVTDPDVADGLCDKLAAAEKSAARGNTRAKQNQLKAFRNQLAAQTGKAVSTEHAEILLRLVGAL